MSRIGTNSSLLVASHRGDSGGVFVKTSSRSPKDAQICSERLGELYAREVAASDRSENSQMLALLKAAVDMLKCASAAEAMQLMCCSERIYQDMLLAKELAPVHGWAQNFLVREWVDIPVEMEFRCARLNEKERSQCARVPLSM